MRRLIASLGGGPAIPTPAQVSTRARTRARRQELFIARTAPQCHNFVGAGGALTYGKYAPALNAVDADRRSTRRC